MFDTVRTTTEHQRFLQLPACGILLSIALGRAIHMAEVRQAASHSYHGIPREAVDEELSRLLASHEFRTSKRCQDFLRYVVETTLDGRGDQLKERTIGTDVFGRPASYEPSDDATVRVKASEVRKRLGLYYAGEGKQNAVRIELPAGAYVPDFHFAKTEASVTPVVTSPVTGVLPPVTGAARKSASGIFFFLGVLGLAAVAAFFYYQRQVLTPRTIVDEFWEPVLQQSGTPVVLSAAYVPVFTPTQPPGGAPPRLASDFTLLTDQFVGGGDMLAIESLAAMLNKMHRQYQVRIGTEVSFSDLRSSPTVLVGYSYTRWKDLSKDMRYSIDGERRPLMILDNGNPTHWAIPNLTADKHTNEDYAIISRVFQADTRTLLVEIVGITQYGTTAAAELVTSPEILHEALVSAPAGWQKKNLQLVLHTRVIGGVAASPSAVATYYW